MDDWDTLLATSALSGSSSTATTNQWNMKPKLIVNLSWMSHCCILDTLDIKSPTGASDCTDIFWVFPSLLSEDDLFSDDVESVKSTSHDNLSIRKTFATGLCI